MHRRFAFLLIAILGFAAGCGGGTKTASSSSSGTNIISSSGSNVIPLAVNGGPTGSYPDAAFASATVCVPGSTSACVTIDNLLVDTGSTGLRVFQSEVDSLNLPTLDAQNGSAAYNCVNFIDSTYMWGPVQQADVTLGGETASKVPIQVISSDATDVPSSCSNGGNTSDNLNTAQQLGANGILGVGLEPTDCFYDGASVCDETSGLSSTPPYPAYYTCSGSTCNPAFTAVANQVTNPVALFPADNNGVIVELPAVSGTQASVSGSLVFGIGTESNNGLSSSDTILTTVCDDLAATVFNGSTLAPDLNPNSADYCEGGSFIDSGSNGLFFQNVTNIPTCGSNSVADGWYCPSSTESLTATNQGENGASLSTSFTVANAQTLFTASDNGLSDNALGGLAAPMNGGFDWGLPFFFGVNVYVAIDSTAMPSGAPAAPWWAY